jgi:putative peptidoglycan lipid II flippase
MGPSVLGVSVAQISLLINTIFASFLVTGSVTWLYYADRLMELPVGLLGVALGTVLLPSLTRRYADGTAEEYSRLLDWGLRLTVLLAAPCAVALAVLAVPILATLFQHGEFVQQDVLMTRRALIAYSIGLVALILIKILAPAFYARQNVKTPVKIAVITLVATQLMNLAFIWHLKHAGLALAIALAAWVNAGLLYWKLRQRGIYTPVSGWPLFLFKLVIALAVMAAVLLWLAAGSEFWLQAGNWPRIGRLAAVVVAGAASYFAALWLMGFRLADFSRRER